MLVTFVMNNRSMCHNVPLIVGFEQLDGRQYAARTVRHTASDTESMLSLDIAAAYPKAAVLNLYRITR